MVLGWRRRRSTTAAAKKHQPAGNLDMDELVIPKHFICPISLDLMKDPVTLSSGITYDRHSIDTWLEAGNFTCPVTNQVLRNFDQTPNHTLRAMIQEWSSSSQNQRYGMQRVPTPRVPITQYEVSEIMVRLTASATRLDQTACMECINIIKKWAADGERNKRCIVENGAAETLAAAFGCFSNDSVNTNAVVCEEILSALSWMMFPSLDEETLNHLGANASLNGLVWFLKNGRDLPVKQNSILVLKELLCNCNDHSKHAVEALERIEGVDEILFEFIQERISITMIKNSLMIVFYLVLFSDKFRSSFLEMGLVSLLLETILDSEKGITERALSVLDRLCDYKKGREEAYVNALTIPVLVKKILRVSEMATEDSISVVWKLCKNASRQEERVLVETLQCGAFQKVLLVLQVRCAGEYQTKDKATELLKLLNPYRAGLECIESVDFKSIRRSF